MAPANITSRYVQSLDEASPERRPLQASNVPNSPPKSAKNKSPDLDDMARQMNLTPKTPSLRSHFETPSAIVSSFRSKNDSNSTNSNSTISTSTNSNSSSAKTTDFVDPSSLSKSESAGYEYLCRIQAIKTWLEAVIGEPIAQSPAELIAYVRNGIYLAKLANVFLPTKKNVYANDARLEFRHTENINRFFRLLTYLQIPDLFHFELTDLYDAKDVPKVWFCLHAMSYIIHATNPSFPQIRSVVGVAQFTAADVKTAARALSGHQLPNFASADNQDVSSPGSNAYMNKTLSFSSPTKSPSPSRSPTRTVKSPALREDKENPFLESRAAKIDDYKLTSIKMPDLSLKNPESEPQPTSSRYSFHSFDKSSKYYTPALEGHLQNVVMLQALAKGSLLRYDMFVKKIMLKSFDTEFTDLFSVIRGNSARLRTVHRHRDEVLLYKSDVVTLQAVARSKMSRRKLQRFDTDQEQSVKDFQSVSRGFCVRRRFQSTKRSLAAAEASVTQFQSIVRGKPMHYRVSTVAEHKDTIEPAIVQLQAAIRRHVYHMQKHSTVLAKAENNDSIVELQSLIRGGVARNRIRNQLRALFRVSRSVGELQNISRGAITRTRLCNNVLITLLGEDVKMNELFAKVRASAVQKEVEYKKYILEKVQDTQIVPLQSAFRGILLRYRKTLDLDEIYDNVDSIIGLQAKIRANAVQRDLASMEKHYHENIDKVIKAQAVLKSKYIQTAYRALVNMKNPPLKVIRKFAYLLSDSGVDFDEELELSDLKDQILEKSKTNEDLELQIENLDIKLGLLDKNKISIEDFMKQNNKFKTYKPTLTASGATKRLEKLNSSVRRRIDLYSSMFYFLQTKSAYWLRLYERASVKDKSKHRHVLEHITQTYALQRTAVNSHTREEFFYLKLVCAFMESDIGRSCNNIADITKMKCTFWIDFLVEFNNHTPQRAHLKRLVDGPVSRIVEDDELTFESDPSKIYQDLRQKEIRIHGHSDKHERISPQEAITDEQVSSQFVKNLMSLRDATSDVLDCLSGCVDKLPVHIRVLCKQAHVLSQIHFPDQSAQSHLSVAGVILIKHYISNVLQFPENFGYSLRDPISHEMSKTADNLKYLGRVLLQVFSMRPFSDNFMKPLNDYVQSCVETTKAVIKDVINVQDLEYEFEMNEYDDLVSPQRPQLTMKVSDMIAIEKLMSKNIDVVAPSADDQLCGVFSDLDNLVNSADDFVTLTELSNLTLTLAPRTKEESVADSRARTLFSQAKRCLLYIIRVQQGNDLLELFIEGIKPAHEELFRSIIAEEKAESSAPKKTHIPYRQSSLGDLSTMKFVDLKKMALKVVIQLETMGQVTRKNSYQELLNQIVVDIKTKHSQRLSRSAQLQIAHQTVGKLLEKESFLKRQLADYNKHIDHVLGELQRRPKDKKIFNIIPVFSKQYFYHRQLKKNNRLPRFGSYKYSAKKLLDQGVLVDMGGSLHKKSSSSSKVDFMFSCHKAGVFLIEAAIGTVAVPGACSTVTLDQVLEQQYENTKQWEMFEGMVTFDTDQLSALIFKNFYDIRKD